MNIERSKRKERGEEMKEEGPCTGSFRSGKCGDAFLSRGKAIFSALRAVPPVYPANSSIISMFACLWRVVSQQHHDASGDRYFYFRSNH